MGFESTIVTQWQGGGDLPAWFTDKYKPFFIFNESLVASKTYKKFYGSNEFFEDYQKALTELGIWNKWLSEVIIAVLGNDGFISKVVIKKDSIKYYHMTEDYEAETVWNQG